MYIYTLRSVTMSGHVKCKRNSLACKMQEDSACNFNIGHCIFNRPMAMYTVYIHFQSIQCIWMTNRQESSSAKKHGQWSSKNKKWTHPVLILATCRYTTESVRKIIPWYWGTERNKKETLAELKTDNLDLNAEPLPYTQANSIKKGTCPVLILATHRHTTESEGFPHFHFLMDWLLNSLLSEASI